MRMIQFCNVGNIVGGTAACAWSVTKALPDVDHVVLFRSAITRETRDAFSHCEIEQISQVDQSVIKKYAGDFLLLHNIAEADVYWGAASPDLNLPVLQYAHSAIRNHAGANRTVACSRYLQEKLNLPAESVLYQGVPCPALPDEEQKIRPLNGALVVGRICTPTVRKWESGQIEFYRELAERFPQIVWEFVGCPEKLQPLFLQACSGRAVFHRAGWQARRLLHRWHVLLYHHADLVETFGRTVCEAMRTGCVPVVDAAGGFCEQIDQQNGYLCASPQDFIDAIDELSHVPNWQKRSDCSRLSADTRFSLTAFRTRLLEHCLACC